MKQYLIPFFFSIFAVAQNDSLLETTLNSFRSFKTSQTNQKAITETCLATFYADKFQGRKTASGTVFSQSKLTCANNTLKFGTKLLVKNLKNGKEVTVVVNDRKAKSSPVCLDLSKKAAQILDFIRDGKTKVSYTIID